MSLRKRGRNWEYDFYYKKHRYYGSIGRVSKQTAERIEAKIKADVIGGHFGMPSDRPMPTVIEAVTEYLANYRLTHAPQSVRRTTYLLITLMQRWGPERLDRITADRLNAYVRERLTAGHKPGYINSDLAALRAFFSTVEHIMPNPLKTHGDRSRQVFIPNRSERTRMLTDEEEARLWKTLTPELQPIVLLALHTGLRLEEVLGLRWAEVDRARRLLILPPDRTKTDEPRLLPLNHPVMTMLEDLWSRWAGGEHVFLNRLGLPYKDPHHIWRRAVQRAGIDNFRFHDLRHTFASRLILAGVGLETVQELLGHRSITMTRRYTHLTATHVREAVERLEREGPADSTTRLQEPS
jgi:integrase